MLGSVAAEAAEAGLSGLEFASGIPGTVGGAMTMNAGAYGGEMAQVVTRVNGITPEGKPISLNNEEMQFGYRTSVIGRMNFVVTEAVFTLMPDNPEWIRERMAELNAKRAEKQPLDQPSAGSTFKRPEGYFAGKLIQDAGLRGFTVGGAKVSDKHCGFVINKDHATSADIRNLIREVQRRVEENSGIRLEPEVIFLGEF
jgi:UDP-N-acetylmuramate dehydrogenase